MSDYNWSHYGVITSATLWSVRIRFFIQPD